MEADLFATKLKEDKAVLDAENAKHADRYNPMLYRTQEDVANERGLICVYPKTNELFIDIDSVEQMDEFHRRLDVMRDADLEFTYPSMQLTIKDSTGGPGHYHIYMKFSNRYFTELERIAFQAALADDPLKVFLSVARVLRGNPNPTTLFELPLEQQAEKERQAKQLVEDLF